MKHINKIMICAMGVVVALGATSCSDMLDTDSTLVQYPTDIDNAADSVYSVIGIINQMQKLADRTVILGEVRGDLTSLTSDATLDLQHLADFTACGTAGVEDTTYNKPEDYYSVINNCNYFLLHADSTLAIRNEKVFAKEIAVVHSYRAWTYLQLALTYGKVPLVTKFVSTEKDAQAEQSKTRSSIVDICNYFISDLQPYVNVPYPSYGEIGGMPSKYYFIPVRLMLGELCLWAGRYQEAAQYYHDFLTASGNPVTTGTNKSSWFLSSSSFKGISSSYSSNFSNVSGGSYITVIPMETSTAYGYFSDLSNVFNSIEDNKDFYQAGPSSAYTNLSRSQIYCSVYVDGNKRDTLYSPTINTEHPLYVGDLRLNSIYQMSINENITSDYSKKFQTIMKINKNYVGLYRPSVIYLHFAEALNLAGYPEAAFCVLKYGLTNTNIGKYVGAHELANSGTLLSFSKYDFTNENTAAIHDFGCGDSYANEFYNMPYPTDSLATYADTLAYEQPRVENLIFDEMALETSFEGYRFYDLMRYALRHNDPSYLAKKVAYRSTDATYSIPDLYNRLLDTSNWYLPLK
jgi:starch-binding outer membrane protein, SusD/RagB family